MTSQNKHTNLLNLSVILLCAAIASTVLISGSKGGNTANFFVTAAFVCVATATALLERRSFQFFPEIWLLMLWLCYSLLPSMGAEDLGLAISRIRQMIQIIVIVLLSINVMIWYGRTSMFALVYFASGILAYIAGLAGWGLGVIDESVIQDRNSLDRITGTHGNANSFGMICLQGQLAATFFIVQAESAAAKRIAGLAIAVLGVAVVNTGSRTAFIGMIFFIFGLAWIYRIWRIRNIGRSILMIGVLCLVGIGTYHALDESNTIRIRIDSYLANEDIMSRYDVLLRPFSKSGDGLSVNKPVDRSTSDRVQLMKVAWDVTIDSPLGIGLDNFRIVGYDTYAHSNYFELLATTGFPGLALFMAIYLFMLRRPLTLAGRRDEANTLGRLFTVSILTLMITDIAFVSYYEKPYWLFVALAIASIEVFRRTNSNQPGMDP